jgi:hypothetical protein
MSEPGLHAIQGGLSAQQAVANRIHRIVEQLNMLLGDAKACNVEVTLFKEVNSREVLANVQSGVLKASTKAVL